MPLKINKVTASNVEDFKVCENAINNLNPMIQTINNIVIPVHVFPSFMKGGIDITPTHSEINCLRIMQNQDVKWSDFDCH